jgi:hypothetical protein
MLKPFRRETANLSTRNPDPAKRRRAQLHHIAEVFCGSAGLSLLLKKAGFDVLCAVYILEGPLRPDLTSNDDYRALCDMLDCGSLVYVRLGSPCSSFSEALRGAARKRSGADPCGPSDDPKIVERALELIAQLRRRGIYWS